MRNRKYQKPTDSQQPFPAPTQSEVSSRTARRQAEKKFSRRTGRDAGMRRGGRLLSVLFFVFIFLPVFAVFLYVAIIYSPEEENLISASSNEVSFQANAAPITPLVIPDEKPEAKESEPEPAPAAEEPVPAAEEQEKDEAEPEEQSAEQPPAASQSPEEEPAPAGQTYIVKKGDTLYRIAVNQYGTGSAVDKIMLANNLVSPDLSIGDTLILP